MRPPGFRRHYRATISSVRVADHSLGGVGVVSESPRLASPRLIAFGHALWPTFAPPSASLAEPGGRTEARGVVWFFGERESSSALWECGNLAVFARFPRGGGKSGKAGFAFPRFPRARHFHNACLFARRLPLQRGAFEAIAVMTGFDDVSLVGNAIHQGLAETRVRNHFGPLRERQVRTTSIGPFSRRLRKLYFVC